MKRFEYIEDSKSEVAEPGVISHEPKPPLPFEYIEDSEGGFTIRAWDEMLHKATSIANERDLKNLLNENANLTQKNWSFWSKLAENKSLDPTLIKQIVEKYIEQGGDVNKQFKENFFEETLLHIFVQENNIEMVEFLLNKEADIHLRTSLDKDVFEKASQLGCKEIVELFIQKGVDLTTKNISNKALEVAYFRNHLYQFGNKKEIIEILLKNGVQDGPNESGNTLLHYACRDDNYEIAKLLIKYGGDPTLRNNEGKAPYMLLKKDAPLHKMVSNFLLKNKLLGEGLSTDKDQKITDLWNSEIPEEMPNETTHDTEPNIEILGKGEESKSFEYDSV